MATNLTQVITLTREDSGRVTGGSSTLVADDPCQTHTTIIGTTEEEVAFGEIITTSADRFRLTLIRGLNTLSAATPAERVNATALLWAEAEADRQHTHTAPAA